MRSILLNVGSTVINMNEILRLRDVRVHFSVRRGLFDSELVKAVDGVSIEIQRGETVAVVGESGSGKTTLGKVALRLLEPTDGSITLDGKDISHTKDGELRWLRRFAQPIFQDPYSSIDSFMNVYQILEEPLLIHNIGEKHERIELIKKSLDGVRLTPVEAFLSKYPHMLSGGQRQRVGIARALVLQPKFIVADEPVSMIDASSRAEILLILRDLQKTKDISFLYITHDIATARHFSDRIAVMYLGRIVEIGPSAAVIKDPLHPYTKALIDAVPIPDPSNRLKERSVIPGEPASPINIPGGCRFHPRCPKFMADKCEVYDPDPKEVNSKHYTACHLY